MNHLAKKQALSDYSRQRLELEEKLKQQRQIELHGCRYPSKAEVKKSADEVLSLLITNTLSDRTREALKKLTAGLDAIYPFAVIYQAHIEELPATHETLLERLPGYADLPKEIQNKYKSGLKNAHYEAMAEVNAILTCMQSFVKHLNSWEPEHFDDLMKVQEGLDL